MSQIGGLEREGRITMRRRYRGTDLCGVVIYPDESAGWRTGPQQLRNNAVPGAKIENSASSGYKTVKYLEHRVYLHLPEDEVLYIPALVTIFVTYDLSER